MRRRLIMALGAMLLAGCVSEPPAPRIPTVSSSDYDVLWQATHDVVQKRFDIFAERKDEGTMMSDFKRSDPVPAVWAKDSQNTYDTLEEIGYIVRRKAIAVITKNEQGQYDLKLTILRERQAYAPPDVVHTSAYDLYDARTTGAPNTGIRYDESMTWTRLANDTYLEAKMLGDIRKRMTRIAVSAKK